MHFRWGSYHLGRVDVVPGLFYVTTRYWHLNFIPLFPLDGCLVLQGPYGTESCTIGIGWKCVLLTWVRVVLWPAMSMLFMAAYIAFSDAGRVPARLAERMEVAWMLAGGAALAAVALGFTYWWGRAGYDRAVAIAQQFGLPTEPVDDAFRPRPRKADHLR